MKTQITRQDILPMAEYVKIRERKRQEIIEIKKNRRISLGEYAVFLFENYDTLWWQIQEMLYIEKGGEAQIEDELQVYSPLVPQGDELVATFMIEINDSVHRAQVLGELGGIEKCFFLHFASHKINAISEDDAGHTTESGKTSSVHFIRWRLTESQVHSFCTAGEKIMIEVDHPRLRIQRQLPEPMRASLAKDLHPQ